MILYKASCLFSTACSCKYIQACTKIAVLSDLLDINNVNIFNSSNDGISDVKSKGVYFLALRISLTLYNKGGETEIEGKKIVKVSNNKIYLHIIETSPRKKAN